MTNDIRDIAEKDVHRLVLEVTRLLNGLEVRHALGVLEASQDLAKVGTTFDISAPA